MIARFLVLAAFVVVIACIILPLTRYGAGEAAKMETPNYRGNGCTFKFEIPPPPPPFNADRDTWREDAAMVRKLYALNVAHYWSACSPPPTAENQHLPLRSIQ